jgi:hypothetical protein
MLEVWGVDSLQEMLDTSPLQHSSQVVRRRAFATALPRESGLRAYVVVNDLPHGTLS